MPFKLTRPHFIFGFLLMAMISAAHFNGTTIKLNYLGCATLLLLLTAGISIYPVLATHGKISLAAPYVVCVIWISWVFSSILWSQAPMISHICAWVVSGFPFAFLLWAWIKPYLNEKVFYKLLLGITIFYGVWAVFEFFQTSKPTLGPMLYQGNFGALFAGMLLPTSAYFILESNNKQSFKIAILFLLLAALFSTYSRGAIFSYLITLPVLFFIAYKQKLSISKPLLILILLTISSGFCVYGYALISKAQPLTDKISINQGTSSITQRLMIYQSAWEIYKQYSLLGSGINSFKVIYPNTRNPAEHSAGIYVHNDYLQFLQEGGPVLLMLVILPLWLQASLLLKACRLNVLKQPIITAGFTLASSTFFIHAIADFIFYNFCLALFAGFYLAIAYQQVPVTSQKTLSLESPKFMFSISSFAILILWTTQSVDNYIAYKMSGKPMNSKQLLFYLSLNPHHPYPLMQMADASYQMTKNSFIPTEQHKYLKQTLKYTFEAFTYHTPRISDYYVNLAELVRLFPDIEKEVATKIPQFHFQANISLEEQLLQQALKYNPSSKRASSALVKFYLAHHQTSLAIATINAAKLWGNAILLLNYTKLKVKRLITAQAGVKRNRACSAA